MADADPLATYYAQTRRRINENAAFGQAQNNYQQTLLDGQKNDNVYNLTKQFDTYRNKLGYNYAGRGIANSGIAAQGYADEARDRTDSTSQLFKRYLEQSQGLGLANTQLGQSQAGALEDVRQQETDSLASAAAALRPHL